ncbi:hypothetical protein EYF80_004619 [Liparis tanakae]|uniref:Uncharacterized protein n=1 Tax=Liparis tanakae TaxID=230148 RepID=A0A4Z2J4Z0_9TELE|nr:hypothetical protein EYF80_004619 [Liparis tanakae]
MLILLPTLFLLSGATWAATLGGLGGARHVPLHAHHQCTDWAEATGLLDSYRHVIPLLHTSYYYPLAEASDSDEDGSMGSADAANCFLSV